MQDTVEGGSAVQGKRGSAEIIFVTSITSSACVKLLPIG